MAATAADGQRRRQRNLAQCIMNAVRIKGPGQGPNQTALRLCDRHRRPMWHLHEYARPVRRLELHDANADFGCREMLINVRATTSEWRRSRRRRSIRQRYLRRPSFSPRPSHYRIFTSPLTLREECTVLRSACLSVCPLEISKTTRTNFTKFFVAVQYVFT